MCFGLDECCICTWGEYLSAQSHLYTNQNPRNRKTKPRLCLLVCFKNYSFVKMKTIITRGYMYK